MAANKWGPVTHPVPHHHPKSSDGHVALGTPGNPLNTEAGYDATDGRQDDSSANAWKKVDHNSGPAGGNGSVSGPFDDGPGPWKQT